MSPHPIALALVDALSVPEDGEPSFDPGVLAAVERDLATPHEDTDTLFVALVELCAVVHEAGWSAARDGLLAVLQRVKKLPHLAVRGGESPVADGIEASAAPWSTTPRVVGQGPKTGVSLVALRAGRTSDAPAERREPARRASAPLASSRTSPPRAADDRRAAPETARATEPAASAPERAGPRRAPAV